MPNVRPTMRQWTTWACAGLLLGAAAASAQTVYRILGPDGRVTFSDQPPPNAAAQAASPSGTRGASPAAGPALPYALQQVANRFPVTLYTGSDCAPCDSARQLLLSRGVPFAERTVRSDEDVEALKRLSGDASLPFGSIGRQQLKGFSDLEWTQFLDAAGYPKSSQLPSQYRPAPATPLVATRAPAPAPTPAAPDAQTVRTPDPQAPVRASPANPAGITF